MQGTWKNITGGTKGFFSIFNNANVNIDSSSSSSSSDDGDDRMNEKKTFCLNIDVKYGMMCWLHQLQHQQDFIRNNVCSSIPRSSNSSSID